VGNGRVEGRGDVLLSAHPTASGEVAIRGLELADLNPLFDLPTLGKLSGQADGNLQLSWNGADLHAKGTVEGRALSFDRLGKLDRVRGPIYLGHQVLTTPGMQAVLGGQPLQLGGSVSLTKTPRLDLSLRSTNADVAPMLASFRWRELLGASNPSSHEKTLQVSLPGREQFTAEGASWTSLLDHWQRTHQEPINQANLHLAKTPFWEAIKGKLFLDAALQGPVDDLGGHLKLQLRDGIVYERPLDRAVLSATLAKNVLAVPYLEVQERSGGLLMAQGKLGAPQEKLVISGYHLKLDTFNPWLESLGMKVDGNGSFSVALSGPLEDPRLALSAKVTKGRVEDFVYDEASAEASITQGVLKIERASVAKDGKEATISGSYPLLDPDARIHLALRMEDESLGILTLFTKDQVEWQGGQGFVEVNLAGTPLHPNLSGRAELAGIDLKVEGLKDPISRIRGSLVLDNNHLEVSPLSARFGQGEIQVTGQVAIENYLPQTMDLRVHSRPFKIRLENNLYDGLVEANLHLFGKMEKPTLSGMIVLSRGMVTIQPETNEPKKAGVPLALKDLTLSLGSGVSLKADPIPASLALDLSVQGALMVNGTFDSPVPRGTIKIKGGTVLALTNAFTVTDGKAEFNNTSISQNELDPILDVQARSRLYDYAAREYLNVTTMVTGTLQNLKLGFQSDRLDRDQDYILNILSKKQLIDQFLSGNNESGTQLSGSSILTREATDLVSNYSNRFINGVFANRLENLVPILDDVGFDLVTDPSLQKELSSIGFNFGFHAETKPLMNNLTLGYRHQFRNQNRDYYRWAMNYRLNRFLGLQLSAEPNDSPYGRPVADSEKDGINGALQLTGQFRF
ncbi:MAG: translocation/assembly module TamB domain-containing protein, partial [Bacteroidota bacterium]